MDYYILSLNNGRIEISGGTDFWGEFQACWKEYPLILTRQLTPQASKGKGWRLGDLHLAFFLRCIWGMKLRQQPLVL
jgi:hypothetical protein